MSRKETTLHQAHRIAEDHGLYVVPVSEGTRCAWVVYRKLPHTDRGTRIGRSCDPSALLRMVKHAAGVAGKQPAPAAEEPAL